MINSLKKKKKKNSINQIIDLYTYLWYWERNRTYQTILNKIPSIFIKMKRAIIKPIFLKNTNNYRSSIF